VGYLHWNYDKFKSFLFDSISPLAPSSSQSQSLLLLV
jgi:hypothetical protein